MSIKKEIYKTIGAILLFEFIFLCGILNFSSINRASIFSVIAAILFLIMYLLFLKNDLEQIKNEYENDINEYDKQWNKNFEEMQKDLEKRDMTFSGEAVKKLGNKSAYTPETLGHPIPKGELKIDQEDYKKFRTKKFELDFKQAKYKVLFTLLKK